MPEENPKNAESYPKTAARNCSKSKYKFIIGITEEQETLYRDLSKDQFTNLPD